MRSLLLLALLVAPACIVYGPYMEYDFDPAHSSVPGNGLTVESGVWTLASDGGRNFRLVQSAASRAQDFNLLLLDGHSLRDFELSVRLQALGGEIDQGGGLVWRARDEKNYFLARWNPLESNLRVYAVIDGQRQQLATRELALGTGWHTLRVWVRKEKIEVYVDGERRLALESALFPEAGQLGLWTKADARTEFDDLRVQEL